MKARSSIRGFALALTAPGIALARSTRPLRLSVTLAPDNAIDIAAWIVASQRAVARARACDINMQPQ